MTEITRILLVDDDTDDQELFCQALTQLSDNIECDPVSNGYEALQLLARKKVDVIFLDMYMPLMNGFELLPMIKSNDLYKHIPVVIYTQSMVQKDTERCIALGADAILEKPFSILMLAAGIKQHLSGLKKA